MADSKDKDARSAAEKVRVLIVDNDKALAHAMTESLDRVGYPCTTAFSGKEGVKDAASIVKAHLANVAKWDKIHARIGNDVDKFAEVLWDEVFSKLDPDKM